MGAFETALKQLAGTNWKEECDHNRQGSYVALVREYCRRAALWADKLSCTSKWPFFNIPEVIQAGFVDARIEPAVAGIEFGQSITRQIGTWYLLWHSLADFRPDTIQAFDLPAPYEPLIALFERGCNSLNREHHLVYVGVVGLPVTNWRSYFVAAPFTSFDSITLDEFDQLYQREFARRAYDKSAGRMGDILDY